MAPITSFFAPKSKRTAPSTAGNGVSGEAMLPLNGKRELDIATASGNGDSKRRKEQPQDACAPFFAPLLAPSGTKDDLLSHDVQDLVSHLDDIPTDEITWRKKLQKHFSSPGFAKLAKFVANARQSATVYPPPCDTFSALNLTPLHKVKVVIVGQDPYHGPNQGHGLCFSVRKGVMIPPSLRNIYKELREDAEVSFPSAKGDPSHGNLERWAKQGVLLMNSVLTVKRGEANSHKGKGWESFTDEVIRILDRESRSSGKGLVFLLWGKPASKKAESIIRGGKKHTIISTSHPSPLGASKTNSPFLGSKCFSRCNSALQEMGHEPIDWNVDGDL